MSCSCGVSADGKTAGCNNNGGCSTGGCNKLNVFDWLSNMDIPVQDRFDVVEVRFKNGRKEFYRNAANLELVTGEAVVVDVQGGHHLGYVSMQGELVRLQMKKKKVPNNNEVRKIYRKATLNDLEKLEEVRKRENPAIYRTRNIILEQKLAMKLTDVEFQADNTKATFYYSADERVDFRELIKVLASEFKIRVEMRQISLRQEASRLGGIGSCGRELCCSTWLTDFRSVSTSAARYQNLSLNPGKLSGQCGRLKCCLNYELETYMDALEDIPEVKYLKTKNGEARLQKTDIFRKLMWFSFEKDNNWHPISTERVKQIMAMNKNGELPESLTLDTVELTIADNKINRDLEKMDEKFRKKDSGSKKRRNNKNRNRKKKPGQQQANSKGQPQATNQQTPKEGGPNKGQGNRNKKRRFRNKKTNNE